MTDLSRITADDFDPAVGSVFRCPASDGTVLELLLASVRRSGRRSEHREGFRLLFTGPADQHLLQGTYELHHDALGSLLVFLVPVGSGDDGYTYEAVFT